MARLELLDIVRIGHEASMRGSGLSMREALRLARYGNLRASFDAADLRPLLEAHPELVESWLTYSEDKRTSGGWYVVRSGEIGRIGDPEDRRRFESMKDSVAEYVVRELDFWASLDFDDEPTG